MLPPLFPKLVSPQQHSQSDLFKTPTHNATENPPTATQSQNENHYNGLHGPNYLIQPLIVFIPCFTSLSPLLTPLQPPRCPCCMCLEHTKPQSHLRASPSS